MRRALLVATSDYSDSAFERLQAPNADAAGLQEVLEDPVIGGYEVKILLNAAHHDAMLAIDDMYSDAGPDDLVLLYVSGHGVKDDDGRLYLAMTNSKLNRLGSTAVPATFVHDRMTDSQSRAMVVWLDCCFSGAFPRGYLHRAGRHVDIKEQLLHGGGAANALVDDDSRGYSVMTSSTALQYSYELDGSSLTGSPVPSVFTRELIEGLWTGEADRDRDGGIDVNELYQYVLDRMRELPARQQPTLYSRVEGKLYVANNPNPEPAGDPDVPKQRTEPDIAAKSRRTRQVAGLGASAVAVGLGLGFPYLWDRLGPSASFEPAASVVLPHNTDITDVAFSPGGELLATAGGQTGSSAPSGQVQLWDAVSGRSVTTFNAADRVETLQFSPDGRLLASGAWDDNVTLWDVGGRRAVGTLSGHHAHITDLAFSRDGRLLATTGADDSVRVWDVADRREIAVLTSDRYCFLPSFSADAGLLSVSCDSGVWVWDLASRQPVAVVGDRETRSIGFNRAGTLVRADDDGAVRLWDYERRQSIMLLPPRSLSDSAVVVLDPADDRILAATTSMSEVQVWDTTQQKVIATLTGHGAGISDLEFSPDGRKVVTASSDNTARIWPAIGS